MFPISEVFRRDVQDPIDSVRVHLLQKIGRHLTVSRIIQCLFGKKYCIFTITVLLIDKRQGQTCSQRIDISKFNQSKTIFAHYCLGQALRRCVRGTRGIPYDAGNDNSHNNIEQKHHRCRVLPITMLYNTNRLGGFTAGGDIQVNAQGGSKGTHRRGARPHIGLHGFDYGIFYSLRGSHRKHCNYVGSGNLRGLWRLLRSEQV